MDKKEHVERHIELHRNFDELLADYFCNTDATDTENTVMELLTWAYAQTKIETIDHEC